MRCLGVVPARGGSKRLPRKNLLELGGLPLVAWTIRVARESGACDRVVVSTDDAEVADVARAFGAEVPFLRPEALARDNVPNQAAVDHLLGWLKEQEGYEPEAVMNLQPTSPFRSVDDLRAGLLHLKNPGVSSVVSVCPADVPPHLLRMLSERGDSILDWRAVDGRVAIDASDRPQYYQLNGAVYVERYPKMNQGHQAVFEMPRERSLDIDDRWDLEMAREIVIAGKVRVPQDLRQ